MSRFPSDDAQKLLANCRRCCCICHRFCGVKMEVDHIVPRADDGQDTIDNAIPVCFDCHAEIHLYNDKHPRGRKFRPEELRMHRDRWLELCCLPAKQEVRHEPRGTVGPIQAMIDELEFDLLVSQVSNENQPGCPFLVEQFCAALKLGSVALLKDSVREPLLKCYRYLMYVNEYLKRMIQAQAPGNWADESNKNQERLRAATPLIKNAKEVLLRSLQSEDAIIVSEGLD